MGHLGQRQRQRRSGRSPELLRHLLSGQIGQELRTTFDPAERAKIAVEMQQELLDDNSYVFCSFLRMSMIMKANVSGLEAHTCDFYELTADLDIQ